ncbi:MAG: GntR family transcriptional regulator [Gemmatimonadota bacterium]|nr:MAG: GntR family transcriptional regulator [Gemmatimonadota bacterium]
MLLRLDPLRPLAEQVYEALGTAIRTGELAAGERLPPSRRLAIDLGVSRNTVVAAYQQLQAEGYVETRGAAGTRVARDIPSRGLPGAQPATPPAAAPAGPRRRPGTLSREGQRVLRAGSVFAPSTLLDRSHLPWNFDYNTTVSDPIARRAWHRVLRRVSSRYEPEAARFDFRRQPGPLHEALVDHLRLTRGVVSESRRIILTNSAQQAFQLAARLTVNPGDSVVVEDPHYLGVRRTLATQGARIVPVGVDRHGLRVDRLPRTGRPRLVYTTPSHQFPTGAVQPLGRRLMLLDWARRHRAWILENDHNCEYRYEGTSVPSIQGLDDGDRVIYVGSFNRLFSPPPALGFMVVPESLVEVFRAGALIDGVAISRLEQEALAEFFTSRDMEKLLRRAWRNARAARGELLSALRALPRSDAEIHAAATGMHLHVALRGWSLDEVRRLVARAEELGVGVYPDEPFYLKPAANPGLLLGFWPLSADEIHEGVSRLGQAMRDIRPD